MQKILVQLTLKIKETSRKSARGKESPRQMIEKQIET